ncbi:MAG: hypothetical protein EXS18_03950 [Verrucomicrobiae bacterium]|nr:hypothetical protein [Verrucomicrobiae bacterium]
MRGPIAKEQLKAFFTSVIDSRETERVIMALDPRQFSAEEQVQAALVALQDAVAVFQGARYALVEAQAHLAFHGTDADGTPTPAAIFYSQFYVEDAYLRLPRAADLVATTLMLFLEIPIKDVQAEIKTPGGLSAAFAKYLGRHIKKSNIAKAFQRLYDTEDWKFVVAQREAWLRGQSVRIQGVGIAHSRQVGWDIMEKQQVERSARDFGLLTVNPVVRRSQLEYSLPTLFSRAKGGYNSLVTLLHSVYEEFARSSRG